MTEENKALASVSEVQDQGGENSPAADVKEVVTATTEESQKQQERTEKTPEQKRLAELAFRAREAERKAHELTEREADLRRQLEEAKAGKGGGPKAEDFESYEAYLEARQDWVLEQKLSERSKKSEEESRQSKAKEESSRKAARIESVMTEGATAYQDFEGTVRSLTEAVTNPEEIRMALDACLDSDVAKDLLYYLGKNQSVVSSLRNMTPTQQAREIGRLEERLQSKKTTAAPEPVQPLKGTGGRVTSDTPPTDPIKYREWRAKQK